MKGKKDPTYKDPAKREKRDLRIAGYGGSGKVTRVLKVILREGFLERKRNQSPANAFVQKNVKTLCTATRDKDTKEIDSLLEDSGRLYPMEIKKTAMPDKRLTRVFGVIDMATLERGTGAVLCTSDRLSAFDSENLIVPVWGI